MTTRTLLATLTLALLAASTASADDDDYNHNRMKESFKDSRVDDPLSPREARYVKSLEALSGAKASDTSRLRHVVPREFLKLPSQVNPPYEMIHARGIQTRTGKTEVTRLQFKTPELAQRYALHVGEVDDSPFLIEARGNQVLLVRSPDLKDPAKTTKIREAAWGVLPVHGGAPSISAVFLENNEFILESRLPKELDEMIRPAFKAAMEQYEKGNPTVDVDGREAWVRDPKFYAHVGEEYWTKEHFARFTMDHKRIRTLERYAESFGKASRSFVPHRGDGPDAKLPPENPVKGSGSAIRNRITGAIEKSTNTKK